MSDLDLNPYAEVGKMLNVILHGVVWLVVALIALCIVRVIVIRVRNDRLLRISSRVRIVNLEHRRRRSRYGARYRYYAAFEFESGDKLRIELTFPQYDPLRMAIMGTLTLQGSRYIGFVPDSDD
ncbi:MAG: DUF2500 domain-containing protein [Oscillospiraceae bacterium]|jgi:hypothetical protein|nr:DUF2500 domain-containing protein [Oscillospiraceae bacterium]